MTSRRTPAWWRRRSRDAPDAELMQRLAAAITAGDATSLRDLLATDVTLIVDGGPAGTGGEIAGRDAVAGALLVCSTDVAVVGINGAPGLVARRDGRAVAAVCASARRGLLVSVWSVRDPEKLRRLRG